MICKENAHNFTYFYYIVFMFKVSNAGFQYVSKLITKASYFSEAAPFIQAGLKICDDKLIHFTTHWIKSEYLEMS